MDYRGHAGNDTIALDSIQILANMTFRGKWNSGENKSGSLW